MAVKPKTPQPETPYVPQGRDVFQTPAYATKLLVPYIPKRIEHVWECASGEGKIAKTLREYNYKTTETDLLHGANFLQDGFPLFILKKYGCIITNPPYSLKKRFYERCRYHDVPFALLIPADYSQWIIKTLRCDNAEKIIPERRIDFVTPSGKSGKDSAAQFHSMWLTWGFGIGKSETFVDLTLETKKDI